MLDQAEYIELIGRLQDEEARLETALEESARPAKQSIPHNDLIYSAEIMAERVARLQRITGKAIADQETRRLLAAGFPHQIAKTRPEAPGTWTERAVSAKPPISGQKHKLPDRATDASAPNWTERAKAERGT